jgi:hypothetical protein
MAIPSQDPKICTKCKIAKPRDTGYYWRKRDRCVSAECKECTKARTKEFGRRPHVKKRVNAQAKIQRGKLRSQVFNAYGGFICACCGESEPAFLSIDHIHNDGAAHRKQVLGSRTMSGYMTYKWLRKNGFPPGFQVLCMNCQHGKRMCRGICPHQQGKA